MKVILVEDENFNAEVLVDHLHLYDPRIEILAKLPSKEKTKLWIEKHGQADLVFCDIELLDGNVFSMLRENIITCPIIFTTAYNTFYQDAFDVNGIAYLLKPVNYDRFHTAMKKFENLRVAEKKPDWNIISELLHQKAKSYKERIVLKNDGDIHILNTEKTVAIMSNSGKLTAIDDKGIAHEFRYKLATLSEELNPKTFFQINRGEIININYIEKIESYFGDRLSIKMQYVKAKLITSASATAEFRKWLG